VIKYGFIFATVALFLHFALGVTLTMADLTDIHVREVSDGNMNRVFLVSSADGARSLAVPAIHGYDPENHALVMEDMSDLEVLRTLLNEGEPYGPHTSARIGEDRRVPRPVLLRHQRLRHAVRRARGAGRGLRQPRNLQDHRRRRAVRAVGRPASTRSSTTYLDRFLRKVWTESIGYAGTEIIRRIIGFAHLSDLTTLPDPAPASRSALLLGRELIVSREELRPRTR
jgi:5-methylthioribose kinase